MRIPPHTAGKGRGQGLCHVGLAAALEGWCVENRLRAGGPGAVGTPAHIVERLRAEEPSRPSTEASRVTPMAIRGGIISVQEVDHCWLGGLAGRVHVQLDKNPAHAEICVRRRQGLGFGPSPSGRTRKPRRGRCSPRGPPFSLRKSHLRRLHRCRPPHENTFVDAADLLHNLPPSPEE